MSAKRILRAMESERKNVYKLWQSFNNSIGKVKGKDDFFDKLTTTIKEILRRHKLDAGEWGRCRERAVYLPTSMPPGMIRRVTRCYGLLLYQGSSLRRHLHIVYEDIGDWKRVVAVELPREELTF